MLPPWAGILAVWILAFAPSVLRAQTTNGTWIGKGGANTNWITATNWVGNIVAGGINSTATFGVASNYSVRLTTALTNGHVSIGGASNYNFYSSGGGAWKWGASSGTSTLTVSQRTNQILFTPTLNSTQLNVSVSAGAQLSMPALAAPNTTRRTVTKSGAGTWILNSSATTLNADWILTDGIFQLNNIGGLGDTNSDLTFNGGTLRLGASLDPQWSRVLTVGAAGGKITFTNSYTLSINDTNQLGGSGILELAGTAPAQKLAISKPQSNFVGTLMITGGQAQLTHSNALGSGSGSLWITTNGSATLNTSGSWVVVSNLTLLGGSLSNLSSTAGLSIRGAYSDNSSNTLALNGAATTPYGTGSMLFQNGRTNTVYSRVVPYAASADPVLRADGSTTAVEFRNRIDVNGLTGSDVTLAVNNGARMTLTSDASINTMRTPTAANQLWLRSDPTAGAQGTVRFDPGFNATTTSSNRIFDIRIAGAKWITTANANLPTNGIRFEGQSNGVWRIESVAQTYARPITITTNASIDTVTDLTVSSLVMSTANVTLSKVGTGTLTLNPGTYTMVGSSIVRILEGHAKFMAVWSNAPTALTLDVRTGAELGGSGAAGPVTSVGGTIRPGMDLTAGTYARFQARSMTLDSASTLALRLGGTAANQFDSVRIYNSGLTLGNATLDLSLDPGFTATLGQTVRIVDVNSGSVTGTFAGLPGGSSIYEGAYTFSISYAGGTGNDVVLTVTAVPEPATIAAVTALGLAGWTLARRRSARSRQASVEVVPGS